MEQSAYEQKRPGMWGSGAGMALINGESLDSAMQIQKKTKEETIQNNSCDAYVCDPNKDGREFGYTYKT